MRTFAKLDATELTRLANLANRHRALLIDDVMPFWQRHAVDSEYGGFLTALDRSGQVIDTDKGMWQQGRFSWLLGKLYNTLQPREDWLELCRDGIEFIDRHGFDSSDGRMWFHVAQDGQPIRKRRYAYTESFAAIAYGEYSRVTQSSEYAAKAERCFLRFAEHIASPKFTDARPMQGLGVPMITIVAAQELRESTGMACADRWIQRSIETIATQFVKDDLQCVMETVGANGEVLDHFDGRLLNPGHAIEGAWFIMHEGMLKGDSELIQLGCKMLDWMWQRGWDQEHGGMRSFCDLHGLAMQEATHDMKYWWPHNETILATLYAYVLTGDRKYAEMHAQVDAWAFHHFADEEHGEWFGYLHRDGSPASFAKGNLWKGPFHLPRMHLYVSRLLDLVTQ